VVEAMTQGWAAGWRAKEWLKKGVLMTNADLWKRLMELCDLHRVEFRWVKGHAGDVENERCDALSMMALAEQELPEDEGYEEEVAYREERGMGGGGPGASRSKKGGEGELVEGGPCRKCGGVLERRVPRKKGKGAFYYAYYLYCAGCGTNYLPEEAKRFE
jgi:ribonuclease HI